MCSDMDRVWSGFRVKWCSCIDRVRDIDRLRFKDIAWCWSWDWGSDMGEGGV